MSKLSERYHSFQLVRERTNNLYCLNTSRKQLREKKKGKRQEGGRKQSVERRGDDASCHELSLVTAVTEKATDSRDYNYSFQQPLSFVSEFFFFLRVTDCEG